MAMPMAVIYCYFPQEVACALHELVWRCVSASRCYSHTYLAYGVLLVAVVPRSFFLFKTTCFSLFT